MKTLIVVPYRDREEHLKQFIPCMHETLSAQGIDYGILIVEQEAGKPFNRGKLLNIGFDYTKGEYDNYCFHDVDLIPETADYSYCENPTHLSVYVEQFDYKPLPYQSLGGVAIFDKGSFLKINGFSNEYFGWGREDNDLIFRCTIAGVIISERHGRYRSLPHGRTIDQELLAKNTALQHRRVRQAIAKGGECVFSDGLETLKYEVVEVKNTEDKVTHIIVSI